MIILISGQHHIPLRLHYYGSGTRLLGGKYNSDLGENGWPKDEFF